MKTITTTTVDQIPAKREWMVPLALLLLSLAIAGFTGYTRSDLAYAQRITTVEVQQKNDGDRLERIERKIDQVLDKLK